MRKCHHFPLFADTLSFYDPKNTALQTMKPYIVPKYVILVRFVQRFVNQRDNAFVVRKVVFGKVKGTLLHCDQHLFTLLSAPFCVVTVAFS